LKKFVLFLIITPTFLIGQSNKDAMVIKDTVGINEVEWIDYYALHQKDTNKPFTGVVKFDGELNYRNKRKGRFLLNNYYFSAVTFVSGKVDGLYTVWGKESGQKKSEITLSVVPLSSGYGLQITGNGPYTLWYKNGQMADKGYFINGKRSSRRREWYKNGQLKAEANYNFGTPEGKFMIWDENGQKSYERYFHDRKVIRKIERDKNGKIIKEWPAIDKDTYGLKIVLNEIVSILKLKNYDAFKKLIISKEDFINIQFGDKENELSNQVKKISKEWSKLVSKSIDKTRKERAGELFEKRTISAIVYNYILMNEDKTSKKVKWPKSINYDISKATLATAEITILLAHYSSFKIKMYLSYINNRWCFIPNGRLFKIEYIN
jgi:antitoxin component YwqK of YwqJK toxin-antitoxin module